jgi:hypothetical protein
MLSTCDYALLKTRGSTGTYLGSYPHELFASWTWWDNNSSVTAIATVHTSGSFVIGADGRRFDSKTNTVETDKARKIFWFQSDLIRLAYAWTGSTQASDQNGTVYDLLPATEQAIPVAAKLAGSNFAVFVSELCRILAGKLPTDMINMPQEELARVILVGYFRAQAFTVQIQALYPATTLLVHPTVQFPAQFHRTIFSGALSVYPPYADRKPQTSAEAISFVHQYIQECVSSSNPDCAGIGGHVHITEITPQEIRWIIPPLD